MNTVYIEDSTCGTAFTFDELMRVSRKCEIHTAFIGTWGKREKVELYLITYDEIVLASDPSTAWSHTKGTVVRFCDVVIRVKETS